MYKQRFSLLLLLAPALALAGCNDQPEPMGPQATGQPAESPTMSVDAPSFNFCRGDQATKREIITDVVAGVTYSTTIFVPAMTGQVAVGVYFNNDGSGPVTFANPAWSTYLGQTIPPGAWTEIPLTPDGSISFSDSFWGEPLGKASTSLDASSSRPMNSQRARLPT